MSNGVLYAARIDKAEPVASEISTNQGVLKGDGDTLEAAQRLQAIQSGRAGVSKDTAIQINTTRDPKLPMSVQTEIIRENVFDKLKEAPTYNAPGGRQYKLQNGDVYYNSSPSKKNTWGKVSDENPTYAEHNGKMVEIRDAFRQNSTDLRVYVSSDGALVFTEQGQPIIPNNNGVYRYPNTRAFYTKGTAGTPLEYCDAHGRLQSDFMKSVASKLEKEGFKVTQDSHYTADVTVERSIVLKDAIDPKAKITSPHIFRFAALVSKSGEFELMTYKDRISTPIADIDQLVEHASENKQLVETFAELVRAINIEQNAKTKYGLCLIASVLVEKMQGTIFNWMFLNCELANIGVTTALDDIKKNPQSQLKNEDLSDLMVIVEERRQFISPYDAPYVHTLARHYLERTTPDKDRAMECLTASLEKAKNSSAPVSENYAKVMESNKALLKELEGKKD